MSKGPVQANQTATKAAPTRDAVPGAAVPSQPSAPRPKKKVPAWLRYGILSLIVIGGATLETACWIRNAGDSTWQIMLTWQIVPTTVFLVVLWWLFLSGTGWKLRFGVFGTLVAALVGFFLCFRIKEFSGDMVPHVAWRWQQSAEQKAADYWKSQESSTAASDKKTASTVTASNEVADFPVKPGDWAQFEGPNRDGIAHGVRIRTDWEQQPPRLVWKHPVGAAWSSFAVAGGDIFTQEQRGSDETVVCYDANSGKQVWAHTDANQRFTNPMGGMGPRGTPTIAGNRVYAYGALGILNCLDPHDGRVLWSHDTVQEAGVPALQFGMSGSPLVYDNVVVVNPGGPRTKLDGTETSGHALVAYDRITGKQVWAGGDYRAAYTSPILTTIDGVRQIVIYDSVGAGGYDAQTGKELWRSPEWTNQFDNNCSQPIILPDSTIFLSSGYGTGSMLLETKKGPTGWTVNTRWSAPNKFKLKFNTGVMRDGFVYGLDEGILACLDLKTGRIKWKGGHYEYGQVLLLDNVLLVVAENGDLALAEISPGGGHEIARIHAIEGKTWNHPAISGSRLFVRNGEEAACYDLGPLQTASR
jgi:outer membrane protein assembly factor BamB